jgi:hypothetical protein
MPSSPSLLREKSQLSNKKIEFFSSTKIGHGKAEAPTAAAIIDDVEKKKRSCDGEQTKKGKKKKLSLMYSEARRELSMKNTTTCVCAGESLKK